jgi:hypothetical protein
VFASREDTLRRPGASDDDVQGEAVTVEAGRTARVRLVVERRAGRIGGRVVDASGRPVGDAFVDAERESDAAGAAGDGARRSVRWSWSREPVLTDTSGGFALDGLTAGTYTLRAYRRGGGEAVAEHVRLGASVTLTITSTGAIAGTVAVAGGAPPEQFTVEVADAKAGLSRSERFFRTGGSFAIRDLPAGSFLVSASAAAGTAGQRVELAGGQRVDDVRLVLTPVATVTGRVVELGGGGPVPAMMVSVQPVKGAGGTSMWSESKDHITDAAGRFTIEGAPSGRVYVTAFPIEWRESPYSYTRRVTVVKPGGTHDVGDVPVPRRRIKGTERGGDLGFSLKEHAPDGEPEQHTLVVAAIRPAGPAARSGLVVGDEIITVDGHDVRGVNVYLYGALVQAPEGTTLQLGLARGETVAITLGPPL